MAFCTDFQTASEHELLYTVFYRMTQVFRVNCITYNEVYKLSDNSSHNTIILFSGKNQIYASKSNFCFVKEMKQEPCYAQKLR